jgi:mannose-6-phosphate isomerase-like protein (cupin superfamily)
MLKECAKELEITELSPQPTYLAPDGSEIRVLTGGRTAGLAHCTLPPGSVTTPVRHRQVEELWFFLNGHGEVWRRYNQDECVTRVSRGTSLAIPPGAHFQFRNTSTAPLEFVIATIPPWPGPEEAVPVEGLWKATAGAAE